MTLDNEREVWREAVRAFRLAATALKDPAPALFADLSMEESLRFLKQQPPLVYFSPFNALPDDVLAGSYEHLPGSGSGRPLDPTTGRGTTPAGPGWPSGPPCGLRDLPGAAPPQDDEPAIRPPVFSFRRRGPAAPRQLAQHNQDIRGDSTKEVESKAHTGRFRVPEPAPEDRQQEAPVVVDTQLDPSGTVRPDTDDHTLGEHSSPHSVDLLNDLADETLEAVRRRTPDANVQTSSMSPSQPLPPSDWMTRSPNLGREVQGRDEAPNHRETSGHTPAEYGSPHPVAPSNGLAGGFLDTAGGRRPDPPGSSDLPLADAYRTERGGDFPKPGHEAYGNNAIALIDSLAEHLLPPQVRAFGDLSRLENTPGVGTSTVSGVADHPEETAASGRSPLALSDNVHEEPTSGLTFGPKPSDTDKEVPGVASDRYMDAETFASLVNDVLAEQARRHGVDLS